MDVKWIKITTNIFDDEKIRLIETLPDADSVIVIWFKLLSLAGKCNDCGLVYLSKDIPYTDEMLATILRRPINTVRLALQEFVNLKMIEIHNDLIAIINWQKHQSVDKLEKLKESSKLSSKKYRERQKLKLLNGGDMTVTSRDDTDKIREDKIREDNNINKSTDEECVYSCEYFSIDKSKHKDYEEIYNDVDIFKQYKKMKIWLDDHPERLKKSAKGYYRFVSHWLSRCIEKKEKDLSQKYKSTKIDYKKKDRLTREEVHEIEKKLREENE